LFVAAGAACPGVELPNDCAGVLPNIGAAEVEDTAAGALPPNIGAAALLEDEAVFESALNAGAGAAFESPAELFPNVNAGAEDEDCPKEKPSAGAGAPPNEIEESAESPDGFEPNVVAGALALDGSPAFSGNDARAAVEPNRLPDGAAGAGVLLPNVKVGASGAAPKAGAEPALAFSSFPSRLRLLRSSFSPGMLPNGTDGITGLLLAEASICEALGAGALPKTKAGLSISFCVGSESAGFVLPKLNDGCAESEEPVAWEGNEKDFDSETFVADLATSPLE
jgi:hypothetical protein